MLLDIPQVITTCNAAEGTYIAGSWHASGSKDARQMLSQESLREKHAKAHMHIFLQISCAAIVAM